MENLALLIVDDEVHTDRTRGYHLLEERYGAIFNRIDRCEAFGSGDEEHPAGHVLTTKRTYDLMLLDYHLEDPTDMPDMVHCLNKEEPFKTMNGNTYRIGVSTDWSQRDIDKGYINDLTGPKKTNPGGLFERIDQFLQTHHPDLFKLVK